MNVQTLFVPRREHSVLYRETMFVCCVNHTEHKQKFCGQNGMIVWTVTSQSLWLTVSHHGLSVSQSVLVSNTPRAHDEASKLISGTAPNVVGQGETGMAGGRDKGPRVEGRAEGRIWVQGGRTAVAGTVRPGAVPLANCWTVINLLAPEFGIQILAHPVCKM